MTVRGVGPNNINRVRHQGTPKTPEKVELSGGDEGVKKEWLIIYYGAADNNLTDYLYSDMNEIEAVGSDKNTHIVAFFDAGKKRVAQQVESTQTPQAEKAEKNPPYTLPTPFEGAKIFYLKRDNNSSKVTSPVIAELGQVNSADPKFMADVIASIMEKYPAKHVAVIISDHGGSWQGAVEDEHPKEKFMSLDEISQALKMVHERTGRKIDLLGWDACIMASGEVAYALRPYAKIMVASEDYEGGDGWPYPSIFAKGAIKELQQAMSRRLNVTPEEFAAMIVRGASHSPNQIKTLSAIDLTKMDGFAEKLRAFSQAILKASDEDVAEVRKAFERSENIGYWGMKQYVDIFDLARRVAEDKNIKDQNLKKAAKELFDFRKQLILYNFRNESYHPNAHGLHLEGRKYKVQKESYQKLELVQETGWNEAVERVGYQRKETQATQNANQNTESSGE